MPEKNSRPVVIIRKKRPASAPATTPPSPAPRKARAKTPTPQSTASSVPNPPVPQSVIPDQSNAKQRQMQAYHVLLTLFHERWPQRFPLDVRQIKPLAVGIHNALIAALPDRKPWQIRQALSLWQRRGKGAYWQAIVRGGPRYTLDGAPEGEVTPKEQAHARAQLAAIRLRQKPDGKKSQQQDERSNGN